MTSPPVLVPQTFQSDEVAKARELLTDTLVKCGGVIKSNMNEFSTNAAVTLLCIVDSNLERSRTRTQEFRR